MKKILFKPGFETIFALGLIVVLGLPPVLLAQNTSELEIKIANGDTTINGKNIKNLTSKERNFILKDLKNIAKSTPDKNGTILNDSTKHVFIYKHIDSTGNPNLKLDVRNYQFKNHPGFDVNKDHFPAPMVKNSKRNIQNFDYVSVDNEGISTRIRFTVTDVSNDDLKKIPYVEGSKFEIEDLVLVPEFMSGTILLTFHLPLKVPADIKFVSSEGKTLWDAKTEGGHFTKSFVLGLNGIYFLQIIQGKSISIKRIVKEG